MVSMRWAGAKTELNLLPDKTFAHTRWKPSESKGCREEEAKFSPRIRHRTMVRCREPMSHGGEIRS